MGKRLDHIRSYYAALNTGDPDEVARHFTRLSRLNFSIDQALYPLPSRELALVVLTLKGLGVPVRRFVLALSQHVDGIDLAAPLLRHCRTLPPQLTSGGWYSPKTDRRRSQHSPIVV